MLDIHIDERCVFTYDVSNLAIGVWVHQEGGYRGAVLGRIAFLNFANKRQVEHFREMLDIMLERLDKRSEE